MSSRSRIRRSGTSSSRSFDDGRLTERNGRTVDLRHCVIILTSNLGSAIPTGPGVGFVGRTGSFDASGVLKSVERSFRPELLNRLDRVVVFRPLGRGVMRDLLEKELTDVLRRRGFRMQPWAVEWDEAAIDFLIEKGFTAELGARPLKRAIERHLLTRLAEAIVERTFPEGDQFLFITARPGAGLEVAFVDPDATDEPPGVAPPDGALTLAAVALDPHGSESEAVFLRAELDAVDNQAQHWRSVKAEALASMHEPGFWDSEARIGVLAQVEYLDRLEAATRTARRLAGRLASRRETHSRELVELLSRRLLVLRGALRGLDAGEPSDVRLTLRPGHGDDADACAAFAAELSEMYMSWAAGRGMQVRSTGADDMRILEVVGLGAYTLLRGETGLHVLETPAGESSFYRATVVVSIAALDPGWASTDGAEATIVRRYRRDPSPLVRYASGVRTGRIDRVLAGDFDLIGESIRPD
jgi:ATP-dependent Clp protease ATP-binding subunit ClpC